MHDLIHKSLLRKWGGYNTLALLLFYPFSYNTTASELIGDLGSVENLGADYQIIGDISSSISSGEKFNRTMALFRSSSEQNIFSTVPQLHISAKGGKVFKSAGKQTIALTGETIISSETGNIFHTDGVGSSQIVTGNFKELLANVGANKPARPGFLLFGYGVSGSDGGVIYNSHGEQILGKSPTEPEGVIEKISINCSLTGTQSSTGRGVAVRNFEAEARQMIYMPIEQIGDEAQPFTAGVEDVYGKQQYIHRIGTIYATNFGIAGGTIAMTSDRGEQRINSVDRILVSDAVSNIAGGAWTPEGDYVSTILPVVGIYNWSDSGAARGDERDIGTQYVGLTEEIRVQASKVNESYGIYNRGGVQTIESKLIGTDLREYVDIHVENSKAGSRAFSVFVNPIMDGDAFEKAETSTWLKGNFRILKGDVVVANTTESQNIYPSNSTLYLIADDLHRNQLVLNDNVSLTVRKGARDIELSKLTTQLVLGDDRQETTATYNVVLGKYSSINDQGVFRGRGLISAYFDKDSFEAAKANDTENTSGEGNVRWNFVGKGYGIISGGVLMKNVEKTLANNNSHLDVQVPISADDVPDEHFAYQIMRSAVNNLFVNEGIDNIRERVDLEKWEDDKGLYEKYKYIAGKVYINEGKINGGYEEEYYYEDPEIVGNQNNIRDPLDLATLKLVPTDGRLVDGNGNFTSYTASDRKVTLALESNPRTSYNAVYLENKPKDPDPSGGSTEEPSDPPLDTNIAADGTGDLDNSNPDDPTDEAPAAGTSLALLVQDGKLGYINKAGDFKEITVNEEGQFVDENGFPLDITVTTDNAKALYAWEGEIGEKIFEETVQEKDPPKDPPKEPSSTVDAIDSVALSDYYLWRLENETLYQRMGEVRDRADLEGGWFRVLGGKNTLDKGSHYFKHKYYGIQLGLDHVFNKEDGGSWILGAGLTYTHGKTDLRNSGSGKNWLGSVSLYGVKKFNNDAYLDIIFKASRIHHDYTAISNKMRYLSKGKYHTYAYQIGAELGKKFMVNDEWYIDPQLQLNYGHIKGTKCRTSSDINVRTSGLNSLIGRAGISVGREFKEGSAFVKVDALREFSAKYKGTYALDSGTKNKTEISLKDTWGEITVGGSYNFRKDVFG